MFLMPCTQAALQNFKPLKKRLTAEFSEDTEVRKNRSMSLESVCVVPADGF
ncbi:MAG: hypothetical protein ACI9X0_002492 [Kiritimatiellia bacterium]|jgi:hypothetical protein